MKTTLRILTCGSVDDGKSTLIGRLLQDADLAKEDQLADAQKVAAATGVNNHMAYMCDGLQEEREKGITIDVAHRYFETERHKYILRDCPGHAEFQPNMATGCSQADIAIIMIDSSRKADGCITHQTMAHFWTVGMFELQRIFVCVNKLDLEETAEARLKLFDDIKNRVALVANEYTHDIPISYIPVSALTGSNVVHEDPEMFPWYAGPTLFEALEYIEDIEHPLYNASAAFQITCVVSHPAAGTDFIQGKMLSGCFEQNIMLGVNGGECTTKLTDIHIGEKDTFLMTKAGLSYSLKVEAGDADLRPGFILHKEDGRTAEPMKTAKLRFLWWEGAERHFPVTVHARLHGATGTVTLTAEAGEYLDGYGDYGIVTATFEDFPYCRPYGKERNPLGALVLMDPETSRTIGVATVLPENDYLLQIR